MRWINLFVPCVHRAAREERSEKRLALFRLTRLSRPQSPPRPMRFQSLTAHVGSCNDGRIDAVRNDGEKMLTTPLACYSHCAPPSCRFQLINVILVVAIVITHHHRHHRQSSPPSQEHVSWDAQAESQGHIIQPSFSCHHPTTPLTRILLFYEISGASH